MTTAIENKAAFIAEFKSKKHTTPRGTEHTDRAVDLKAGEAWHKHMESVVTNKTIEAPVEPCQAPKWDDEYTSSHAGGGYALPKKGGVRTSASVANQIRETGKQNAWVVVEHRRCGGCRSCLCRLDGISSRDRRGGNCAVGRFQHDFYGIRNQVEHGACAYIDSGADYASDKDVARHAGAALAANFACHMNACRLVAGFGEVDVKLRPARHLERTRRGASKAVRRCRLCSSRSGFDFQNIFCPARYSRPTRYRNKKHHKCSRGGKSHLSLHLQARIQGLASRTEKYGIDPFSHFNLLYTFVRHTMQNGRTYLPHQAILAEINRARHSIKICLFLIGDLFGDHHDSVVNALINAKNRGVHVQLLLNGHLARQGRVGVERSMHDELIRPLLPAVERLKSAGDFSRFGIRTR